MSVSITFSCDICKVEKKETNKWFQVSPYKHMLKLEPLDYSRDDDDRVIICGEGCLHKYISTMLPTLHQ